MEKYENEDGKIGVIVSYGFGAGWSTWSLENQEYLCMDKSLVEMKLRSASSDEADRHIQKIMGDAPYMGGWDSAVVEWVDKGSAFFISEHDGDEELIIVDDLHMTA